MTDTQRLRQLINRVDTIMREIKLDHFKTQWEIRAALRDALLKTGSWVH